MNGTPPEDPFTRWEQHFFILYKRFVQPRQQSRNFAAKGFGLTFDTLLIQHLRIVDHRDDMLDKRLSEPRQIR